MTNEVVWLLVQESFVKDERKLTDGVLGLSDWAAKSRIPLRLAPLQVVLLMLLQCQSAPFRDIFDPADDIGYRKLAMRIRRRGKRNSQMRATGNCRKFSNPRNNACR